MVFNLRTDCINTKSTSRPVDCRSDTAFNNLISGLFECLLRKLICFSFFFFVLSFFYCFVCFICDIRPFFDWNCNRLTKIKQNKVIRWFLIPYRHKRRHCRPFYRFGMFNEISILSCLLKITPKCETV